MRDNFLKKIKKTVLWLLPFFLGVFLVWWVVKEFTADQIYQIKKGFEKANYSYVLISLFFGILSHISRSIRWNYLLAPLGYYPKILNNFMSVLIGYLLNLALPRAGEVARAIATQKYEDIPFEKGLGTIIVERASDALMFLLVIILALFLQFDLLWQTLSIKSSKNFSKNIVILAFIGFLVFSVFKFFKKNKNPFLFKAKTYIDGLLEGIKSIWKMKNNKLFIFHTIFIWAMYILMFYAVTKAIPATSNLSLSAIVVGFVVGALSMILTNGGFGSYPVFVSKALLIYGISQPQGFLFGILMWSGQTLMIIIFGALSFIFMPIYNRNIKRQSKN